MQDEITPAIPTILDGSVDVAPPDRFNSAYSTVAPWDIGRPQPEFLKIFDNSEIQGSVLDAGCGTGEHAILLAARGHAVLGVDFAPAAIEKAQAKARERGSAAQFLVYDALELPKLNRTFDSAIDSGLFHCFSDENRARYVSSLAGVIRPGGRLILMCFSEHETGPGPRRVTQTELREAFAHGWKFNYIRGSTFESTMHPGGAKAWVAAIEKT